jgi:hypothetical protein
MSGEFSRRRFVAGGLAATAALGDFSFLKSLPTLDARDAKAAPHLVQFSSDIEPLVRLIEDTDRKDLLQAVAGRIKSGTSYQQLLAALMLAGVRGIQPRPVGFKFHAVLVVNSAHLATMAAEDRDRWLPLFWSLDNFKSSQARNKTEGDWHMGPVAEAKVPAAHLARQRFAEAMDAWDEEAVDAAVTSLVRNFGAIDVIEQFWRYGARDFRDIGHKAIYVANAWRAMQTIGWRHAEPILRSLAYAMLDHTREDNPAKNNYEADIPGRENLVRLKKIRKDWIQGKRDDTAAGELLATMRSASHAEAGDEVVKLLNKGLDPASIWDGLFLTAGEFLARQPGIIGLHTLTSLNGLHYAFHTTSQEDTRKYVLLQAAAFLTMFRKRMDLRKDLFLDKLQKAEVEKSGIEEILADLPGQKEKAARKVLSYLEAGHRAEPLMAGARRMIFTRGTDSHDYKFSSAVLEDYYHISPAWRSRFLASSMFWLRGAGDKENGLVQRTRAALS